MGVNLWKTGYWAGASSLPLAISTAAVAADGAPTDTPPAVQSPLITAQTSTGSSAVEKAVATDAPLGTEEIIVRGVRGSLLRSIQTKRDAATIVDAISAEELGKFPNRNVAEA